MSKRARGNDIDIDNIAVPDAVMDVLHEALPREVVHKIIGHALAVGGPAATLATLNHVFCRIVREQLPLIFADLVAAAADELRAAVASGAFDGLRSLCTLPAVRRLVRMRDALHVRADRFIHAWPRRHAATRLCVDADLLTRQYEAFTPLKRLATVKWLAGDLPPGLEELVPAALRECPDRNHVPFYVMWYALRDLLEPRHDDDMHDTSVLRDVHGGDGGKGLFASVMEQWAAADWAGCCVTLLSDSVVESYGQQQALQRLVEHAMRLDLATLDASSFLTSTSKRVQSINLLRLFEFFRGVPCRRRQVVSAGPAYTLMFPPMNRLPAGFTGVTEWRHGCFLDELPTSLRPWTIRRHLRPGRMSKREEEATFVEYATSLRVFCNIRLVMPGAVETRFIVDPLPIQLQAKIDESAKHFFPRTQAVAAAAEEEEEI